MIGQRPSRRGLLAASMLLFFSLLILLPLASASVDLVSPANNHVTNEANITFEYYPAMVGVTSCTLTIDTQSFPDNTINQGVFNTFVVVNIAEGAHTWQIACTDGVNTQHSLSRTLIVDRTKPTMIISSPAEGATVTNASMTLLVTDNEANQLTCNLTTDGSVITVNMTNGTQKSLSLGTLAPGGYQTNVLCQDKAGNNATATRNFNLLPPPVPLYLDLSTNKATYALGEPVLLTIETLNQTLVDIEVCPNQTGFVQCFTPLIDDLYPQTTTLPYTNRTGHYLIEGIALRGNETVVTSIGYAVDNTMQVTISPSETPQFNEEFTLTATVVGAIGDLNYAWALSNGSLIQTASVTLLKKQFGTFTERLVVTDQAGNARNASYAYTIKPAFDITVLVQDSATGAALQGVTVQLQLKNGDGSDTGTTSSEGKTLFVVEPDTYKLYATLNGYNYYLQEVEIAGEKTITVNLERNDNQKPVITMVAPAEGADVSLPIDIRFTAADTGSLSCTLSYAKEGEAWLQQSGTLAVTDASERSFRIESLEEGTHTYLIECEDDKGNLGESVRRTFTVVESTEESTVFDLFGNDPLTAIDQAYGAYDAFTPDQRNIADLLGWEDLVKELKKSIERSERDINSLSFRKDLSDEQKAAERERLQAIIAEAQRAIPIDLAIIEKKESVSYIGEEELKALATDIARQKGYSFTEKEVLEYLLNVQQDFTSKTLLVRAKLFLSDGSEQPLSIVSHTFTYKASGKGESTTGAAAETAIVDALKGTYTLYEVLPEGMVDQPEELIAKAKHEIVNRKPPIIEFGPEREVTYYVRKDLSMAQLEKVKTVLLKRPSASDLNAITGNALFAMKILDWKMSLLLTLALALLIFVLRKADVLHHVRYLFYARSRKKGVHSIKLLINDGVAHLRADELDQATLRYKEAKLSYEQLNDYAKNETYDDLIVFKQLLDKHYFDLLTDRISEAITRDDLSAAIDDYARLEGTFKMLGREEQEALIGIANELARRLGLLPAKEGGGAA